MAYGKHEEEVIAMIATRIYCTRLSLGDLSIDAACVAEDAFAIYEACAMCVKQAAKVK